MTPPASDTTGSNQPATAVTEPRQRIFLPQSLHERLLGIGWSVIRETLFRWSPPAWFRWRGFLLRLFGANVHATAWIAPSARIEFPWNLSIGPHAYICEKVIINCMGRVEIGGHTRISQYSHLCAGTHDYRRRDMRILPQPIRIGEKVWIAADAFVGPGVSIGDGCLLAARSSAFHDLPAGYICVGEPARPVKLRVPAAADQSPGATGG